MNEKFNIYMVKGRILRGDTLHDKKRDCSNDSSWRTRL